MTLLSQALFERYPSSIQSTLLEDHDFTGRIGLQTARIFTFSKTVSVKDEQLFSAVRAALRERKESSIEGLRGHKLGIRVSADNIEITVEGSDRPPVCVPALFVLSANARERIRSIKSIIDQCGPTAPDFSGHLKTATLRDLTNTEVSEILAELHEGVAAFLHNAGAAFNLGQATVTDLVPSDLTFFERFCGPNPGTTDLQTYVTDVLPAYRNSLLNRDLSGGLDISLLGALRQDLCPGPWLDSISDDDVWKALNRINCRHDPYSLLAVLDLALRRRHDKRFHELAGDVVESLRANTLPDNDRNDVYDLIPMFAELTLDRLNLLEGGARRSPFWKRMCAWMHGAMLARLSRNSGLNANGIKAWIQGRLSRAGVIAQMLDLRREPMFSALIMTKAALRGEVIGRLAQIHAKYTTSAESLPQVQSIEEVLRATPDPELPYMSVSPGPLEGNRRPQLSHTETLISAHREKVIGDLQTRPVGPVWSWLAQLAQACRLDGDIIAAGCDAIRHAVIPDDVSLGRLGLSDALLVAIATPDIELRDVVAARLVGLSDRIKSEEDAALIVQTVVLASAATGNDEEWEKWLATTLTDVAVRLPLERDCLLGFISSLEAIEKLIPARAGITARAKAIVTAAA